MVLIVILRKNQLLIRTRVRIWMYRLIHLKWIVDIHSTWTRYFLPYWRSSDHLWLYWSWPFNWFWYIFKEIRPNHPGHKKRISIWHFSRGSVKYFSTFKFIFLKDDHSVCVCEKWANVFRGLYIFLGAVVGWLVSISFLYNNKNGNLKDFYFLTFQIGEGLDLIIKVKQRPKGSLFEAMSFKRGTIQKLMPTTTTTFDFGFLIFLQPPKGRQRGRIEGSIYTTYRGGPDVRDDQSFLVLHPKK